jgi:hypothetical protein
MILGINGIIASSISGATPLLLDLYPNAAAAYSVRKLRTAYTGNAIRVRRSSDNTELNIGFIGENLDTTSLTTFCSGTNGFVTTWYDQSGTGNNATQTTAANQPQIVSSGAVYLENGKPIIKRQSVDSRMNLGFAGGIDTWTFNVIKNDVNLTILFNQFGSNAQFYAASQDSNLSSPNTGTAVIYSDGSLLVSPTRGSLYIDFLNQSLATLTGNLSTLNPIGFGYTSVFGMYQMQECVIYLSNQLTNRTGIESNINTYYGIY